MKIGFVDEGFETELWKEYMAYDKVDGGADDRQMKKGFKTSFTLNSFSRQRT